MSSGELERLLDERAIHEVLTRYCRGIDRCDEQLIRSVYHPGAVDHHGPFTGTGDEFAAWVVPILSTNFDATMHRSSNVTIVFAADAESAQVESYVVAYHSTTARPGKSQLVTVGGRYLDRFERREGVWKIARRSVVIDWSEVASAGSGFPTDGYLVGARGAADPSYENLADTKPR